MAAGKYSPTVRGRGFNPVEPNGVFDAEGFDMYGYNIDGYDRVGKTEWDYNQEALDEALGEHHEEIDA